MAAALLLALAGCTLGPDYERPQAATQETWKAAPGAEQAAAWPDAEWWRGFGSPTLDGYIAAAQRNNTDIGAAAARVLQADAQLRIAGAALLPAVDAGTDVSRRRSGGSGNGSQARTNYSVALSASYEIDFWGKNRASRASAEAQALASRFDRETVALTVVTNTAIAYFQVLEFRDRLAIARDNLANAQRVLAVVEARFRNGAATPLEVAQQRTVVANQRAAIPAVEQQLRQFENALGILLGTAPAEVSVATGSLDDLGLPPVAPGLPSELLARRPDIRSAEAQLQSANLDIQVARAQLFPSIQLTGQLGFASLALSSLFNSAGLFYSLAAGLTAPIFEGGRLSGQVDLTRARFEELVQLYRGAVIAAFTDVENALVATQQLAQQQALQQEAVAQARIAFQLADARYREGIDDLLSVLDAQRSLFSAIDQQAQIKSARLQATVGLFRALGGGWSVPES